MSLNQNLFQKKLQYNRKYLAMKRTDASEVVLVKTCIHSNQHPHPPWLDKNQEEKRLICNPKLVINKQKRETLNPAILSIIVILHIMFNQTVITRLSFENDSSDNSKVFADRSLIKLVEAAPEPSQLRPRSTTSGSHRAPPINGSIFGKRSLGSSNNSKYVETNRKDPSSKQSTYESEAGQGTFTTVSKSNALNYKDLITQVIENFLALNNESDPDKASVAFCRMIVYECTQMLFTRSEAFKGERN